MKHPLFCLLFCLTLLNTASNCVGPGQEIAAADSHDLATIPKRQYFSGTIFCPDGNTPLADTKLELRDMEDFNFLIRIPDAASSIQPAFAELQTNDRGQFSVSVRNSRRLQKTIKQKALGMQLVDKSKYIEFEARIIDPTTKTYVLKPRIYH